MSNPAEAYFAIIREQLSREYRGMYREAGGEVAFPFLTPGSEQYADVLWDWDSWWSNIALRQILQEIGDSEEYKKAQPYERGCVQNFLQWGSMQGWIPIVAGRGGAKRPEKYLTRNMHKPCLAQHAAFLVREDGGDAEWLREQFYFLQTFVNNYRNHHRDRATGLYFWQNDEAIGVDNDPCTYYRPDRSSGSIYLNTMMYRELLALVYLCKRLNFDEIADQYSDDASSLKAAIQEHCWDEWLGFYYSVDLNLKPVERFEGNERHNGQPRDWDCLIQRIGVWSGFMALWAGVATGDQAERMAKEHYRNPDTFGAEFGVRTLSRMEKMYNVRASGNPSSWLGPIWGIANYMTFRGFVRYGLDEDARDLAEKTVKLFGRDLERFGALHEYYQPDNGEPILNRGFQNWNYLVLNMVEWLEGGEVVEEF